MPWGEHPRHHAHGGDEREPRRRGGALSLRRHQHHPLEHRRVGHQSRRDAGSQHPRNPTSGGFGDTPRSWLSTDCGTPATSAEGRSETSRLRCRPRERSTAFDVAQLSLGRLAPPVTGLALVQGRASDYLLAANNQGLMVYDLTVPLLTRSPGPSSSAARTALGPSLLRSASRDQPGRLGADSRRGRGGGNVADRTLAILSWADVADAGADGGRSSSTPSTTRGRAFSSTAAPDAGPQTPETPVGRQPRGRRRWSGGTRHPGGPREQLRDSRERPDAGGLPGGPGLLGSAPPPAKRLIRLPPPSHVRGVCLIHR
jgi:hypothetical protein